MNIVKLIQGSPEWHAHRLQHRNASETATVLGVSPWLTPLQLWELRTGRRQDQTTAAMAHGTAMEPRARECYERMTGHVMQPLVLVDGDYSASLDGLSFGGQLLLEIKCPAHGQSSKLWQQAAQREVPEHYGWQIEHQLMVSKALEAHLFVYDAQTDTGLLVESKATPARWEAIHAGWDAFMACVTTDSPPPLTDRDKVVRDDDDWREAAAQYLQLKAENEVVAARLEAARNALVALASHPSESGHGVAVTRFWKQGSVDYKRVPALQGVDLNAWRGKAREEVRVSLA